jgi:hypothetical protein
MAGRRLRKMSFDLDGRISLAADWRRPRGALTSAKTKKAPSARTAPFDFERA